MHETRLTRRGVLALAGAGLAAVALSACGGGAAAPAPAEAPKAAAPTTAAPAAAAPTTAPAPAQQQAAPSKPATGSAVSLTFWGHNHQPRVELDKQYLDAFLKDNPGIKVEYVVVPQEYEVKLTTAMAAGTGPDGYNLTATYTVSFMAKGLAAELDPRPWNLHSSADLAGLYAEGTVDGFTYQGKVYGVPSEVSNYAPFYNTQMFKDAGLDVEASPPKTWDDLIPLSQKVVKRDGDTLSRRGFDFTYMTQQGRQTSPINTLIGMAYQLGGELFTPDKKATNINTEPFIRAMQFQQDFIYKHKLGSPALLGANQAFDEGSVGATLTGFWAIAPLQKSYPDVAAHFTVKPFPQWSDAKRKSGAAVYGYARMVNSKSSEAARAAMWQVHKAWSDHPEEYITKAGLLQPLKTFVSSDAFKKIEHLQVFLDDATGSPYTVQHVNGIEITNAAIRAMERITQEKADPKTSLDQGKQEIDAIIAKG